MADVTEALLQALSSDPSLRDKMSGLEKMIVDDLIASDFKTQCPKCQAWLERILNRLNPKPVTEFRAHTGIGKTHETS